MGSLPQLAGGSLSCPCAICWIVPGLLSKQREAGFGCLGTGVLVCGAVGAVDTSGYSHTLETNERIPTAGPCWTTKEAALLTCGSKGVPVAGRVSALHPESRQP